ncbi:Ser/Thr protein phosphatase family protein [Gracilibacillus boraciitolerans JCM 21714]|uniref:Ser/Thr protein phosphatase family protein n=1 Tax=Gracilibacillus boraciitolerans JCM 21714 TaxID=1298598 RepID=W4VF68_9BACI|nr:Ser/Thr protein phosphatase family protein [Gracilibacillus boraciitolerans JCM 21714]
MNRRTFLKRIFGSFITLIGLSGGTYYYAKELEPNMLDIHYVDIISKKVMSAFENYKILQFSDTHIGFHYSIEQFEKLVRKINAENADLVVFTGDLIDNPRTYTVNQRLVTLLDQIQAKDGKYWIYGNHDHGGYGTNMLKELFDQSGFELLQNGHRQINKNGDMINIIGVDDVLLGKPDINQTFQGVDQNLLTILLAHEPDYAEIAKDYPVDIQLSGHSHGGQVQLPLIGYLYTPHILLKNMWKDIIPSVIDHAIICE